MNRRDRAFLQDMIDFISLNRLATVLSLYQTATEPDNIAESTMKILMYPSEEGLIELAQKNAGYIQGIMTARIYAELFAGYEDLGAFGQAIKYRQNGGIFRRYATNSTAQAASFLQEIIDSNIPDHPEVTLDVILRLPPVAQLHGRIPQAVFDQLEAYYRIIAGFLYQAAEHYQARRGDAQAIQVGTIPPVEWQGTLAIILGENPPEPGSREDRLSRNAFNRIKHQFLVTGNLAAYSDPTNTSPLEYVYLSREQSFIDRVIDLVRNIARVMKDFASILLLLDSQNIEI